MPKQVSQVEKVGSPRILNDKRVLFVYEGKASSVELVGDFNCWAPGSHVLREAKPDHWEIALDLIPGTRSNYLFVVDGAETLDPANPNAVNSPHGQRSELRMPGCVELPPLASEPEGARRVHKVESYHLGGERTVIFYRVNEPAPPDGYALIVCHDGYDAEQYLQLPQIVDSQVRQGRIPPVVCVMVPPLERRLEYNYNPDHVAFLVNEVLPLVRANYPINTDPTQTLIMGASAGGLAAAYAALRHPDIFGLVATQSGAFSANGEAIIKDYRAHKTVPVRFHICCGLYEDCLMSTQYGAQTDMLETNRHFVAMLKQKGYEHVYSEQPDGHSWRFWQTQTSPALRWLFR
jgi:enterochelin esterase family protein